MNFSEIAKSLRREKGLSQVELAKALNISKSCIAMIEIGKNEPTANTLSRYADYFECSTDYLLGRSDDLGIVSIAPRFSPEEEKLVADYRKLPKHCKELLKKMIDSWTGGADQSADKRSDLG